ncbi:SDR family NAD(P)-dependent oxidoreductase [Elizabethkingia sp. JS20170427COW]|uniref:SDR family NAD(P)-dependent oxidoreductase n=1 Tax=Elizabethkingia sp. JS20170427COW TaxID=2583851 RepID=UPI00111093C6|nr:SDR family NAD(P)-dependent oxidoreductase [Elizabethkingia sp. JS20170427COW]QCX52501.1 SDR family NAD(P)-dependent oxidoreductase [Elizabethkingia sp. JS20170427COW]
MIILGANSEVAQAFVEEILSQGKTYPMVYLLSSNPEISEKFANHIQVKYLQSCEVVSLDLSQEIIYKNYDHIQSDLLFCAIGYLGLDTSEDLYNVKNTKSILDINYAKLIPVLNYFAQKMEAKRQGTIIGLSSVAGDRGRQSNFIYGSAKAGFTAYLSGLRNYMADKKVHVLTVKPGFMDTKMTQGLPLNPLLTASPKQAAKCIAKAYERQRNVIYVLPIWRWIMLIIKNIPEFIFKKLKL